MEIAAEGGSPPVTTTYRATTQSAAHDITVLDDHQVQLNDGFYRYDVTSLGSGDYSLLLNGKVYTFHVSTHGSAYPQSPSSLDLSPEGALEFTLVHKERDYTVRVDNQRSLMLRSFLAKTHATATATTIRAPMPGLIVRVEVEPGQSISQGQGLVVLEAMKMENEIRSLSGGIVKAVHVQEGRPVEKGEALVTLSSD